MNAGMQLCSQCRKKKRETETVATESSEDEFMAQEREELLNQSLAVLSASPCKIRTVRSRHKVPLPSETVERQIKIKKSYLHVKYLFMI